MPRARHKQWPDGPGPVKEYVGLVDWPVTCPRGPVTGNQQNKQQTSYTVWREECQC